MEQQVELAEPQASVRDVSFTELYENAFPLVARFVRQHGGDLSDAKDIFHDAMIIMFEMIRDNRKTIETSRQAYLLGIAKHLWIRKFNKTKYTVSLDHDELKIELPENYAEPQDHLLIQLMERAGKKCLELLGAFYYDKVALDDIAKTFGFSGTRSATVQKFKCIEKMRTIVKQNAIRYDDLA